MRVETERLIVRRFEWRDEADFCEYMLQRVDAYYEAFPDFTRAKAHEELRFRVESDEFYAIELKEEGKVIGNLYLGNRSFHARELGYILNENYQRKGYATEACKGAMERLFQQGVHRIYAECATGNEASWRLMEKLGMRREGHFRKNATFLKDENGRPIYWDSYLYAALNPQEE